MIKGREAFKAEKARHENQRGIAPSLIYQFLPASFDPLISSTPSLTMDPPVSPTSTLGPGSPATSWSSGFSSAPTLAADGGRVKIAESAALASNILARDTQRVRLLLDLGITLIKAHTWVLYDACLCGLEMLHLLLFGSDIDFNIPLAQGGGDTILHFVLRTPQERFRDSKEDIVRLLLRTGTNPFRCDQLGDTAFHLLAGNTTPVGSSTEGSRLLRLLLEDCPELQEPCLSSINNKNDFGDTPLIIAVLYNNIECAQLLLEHGADPFKLGEYGMTALDYAEEREYEEITGLLLGHMTDREQEERDAARNDTPAGGQRLG